jgi:xanthine dehydrogenase YagT iron-sulfur-binding subunit
MSKRNAAGSSSPTLGGAEFATVGAGMEEGQFGMTRRTFMGSMAATGVVGTVRGTEAAATEAPTRGRLTLTVNGRRRELSVDPRTTLLDLLREGLELTGTKKGCDHGQCGACTVLVNGRRINACLTLALAHDGDEVTTVEGLARGEALHPVQQAFLEHDGFQCGYCTPGQICSAVALLEEARAGAASAVTPDVSRLGPAALTDDEIRERMSGNLCRCGAYPGIVAAVRAASGRRGQA